MSLKVKLFSTIISVFLVIGIVVVGVFAASSGTLLISGTVQFIADDVLCTITGSIENSLTSSPVLDALVWDLEGGPSDDERQSWLGNQLTFKYDHSSVYYRITIQNNSAERYIKIKLDNIDLSSSLSASYSFENASGGFNDFSLSEEKLVPAGEERDVLITFSYVGNRDVDTNMSYSYTMTLTDQNHKA